MRTGLAKDDLKSRCTPAYAGHSIITLAIMGGFKFIVPAADPLTPLGVEILGIFMGMVYGWLVVGDLIWPSIAGMIFLGLSDYSTVVDAFASGFGNNTVLLILFFFLFTNIINSAGIIEYVAQWILSRKFAYGRPWVLALLLMLAAVVAFFMVSATAACLVMIPLIKTISFLYGFKPGDKWPMLMLGGLIYVGSTSYMLLPYKTLPLVVFAGYEAVTGETIAYLPYLLIALAATGVAIILFLLMCKFVFRPDVSNIVNCKVSFEKNAELSEYQKFVFLFFAVTLGLLMISNIIPGSVFPFSILKEIGSTGILAAAVMFYLACQLKEGQTINELFSKNISWNIIFLMAAAMSISDAFMSDQTGITEWMTSVIVPLVQGTNSVVFIIIVCVICCIFTNLAHNLTAGAILTPIILPIADVFGLNLPALVLCMMVVFDVGIILPPASIVGAMFHSDSEWVPGKSAYFYGIVYSVLNLFNAVFIVYPLGCMLM